MNPFIQFLIFSLLWSFHLSAWAFGNDNLLPPDQAYQPEVKVLSNTQIEVSWQIAEGYYLYRDKTRFKSLTSDISLGEPILPPGKTKHDEFFGDMEIYRHQVSTQVPYDNPQHLNRLELEIKYQGCADIGVCYPPEKKRYTLNLPEAQPANNPSTNPLDGLLKQGQKLSLNLFENDLLPAEQAFQFFAQVKDANTLDVSWQIAEGYYLYRDKIRFEIDNPTLRIADFQIPTGQSYHDEAFGDVQIFYQTLNFTLPLQRTQLEPQNLVLTAFFQGCAERGVCYPPMQKKVALSLSATTTINPPPATPLSSVDSSALSEQQQIFESLKSDSFGLTLVSFFGFGLLLAFTPCIFPMIPILSGIIVGQKGTVTTRKGFLLSLSYVVASALMYTVFGVLAALFGSNLQATFQEPWIIGLFSAMFVLLSLSMFGFYHLEVPKALQAKLHNASDKHRDGSYWGAALMGAFSSLIVGPCVAAPLAGALIYIGQTGDVLLGGSALFVMGFAMGVPLLVIGASAGSLLPKAGNWLNSTKAIFGVIMLAIALWMLDRVIPAWLTVLFSSSLLIIPAIYLHALDPLPSQASGWQKLWKGLGVMMLIYGVLLLIGLATGNPSLLQPLKSIGGASQTNTPHLTFQRIKTTTDLDRVLAQAQQQNQWVMLDFYADWCVSCKEMEAYTFTDPNVQAALTGVIKIQADVTDNDTLDQALLQRFNLIGPPAILFFNPQQQEQLQARVVGYQDSATFLAGLDRLGLR
jgi:thiol:disulfide interchange protein DsbD